MKNIYYPPKVICLEGSDGSGKTTQSLLLKKCFAKNFVKVLYSREPGGSHLGELIREFILNNTYGNQKDIYLYTASRFIHIHKTILPQLEKGNFIILDRFLPSTLIYQGKNNQTLINEILYLHNKFNKNFFPDLTLVLNITLENSIKRIKLRKQKNFYDKKPIKFHEQIIYSYTQLDKNYNGEVRYINANNSIIFTHLHIVNTINSYFNYNLCTLTESEIKNSLVLKN